MPLLHVLATRSPCMLSLASGWQNAPKVCDLTGYEGVLLDLVQLLLQLRARFLCQRVQLAQQRLRHRVLGEVRVVRVDQVMPCPCTSKVERDEDCLQSSAEA